jgi:phosphatidylglycerol---prolipoprotein diacylglyceryl transferase
MLQQFDIYFISINSFIFFNSIAFLSCFFVMYYRYKNSGNLKHYLPSLLIITLGGFIGSKIYYIFEEFNLFLNDPINVFFSFNGSGFLGGLLLCYLAFYLYTKNYDINLLKIVNLISLGMPVGIIFGRFACLMAGDGCYGTPSNLPWAMTFPDGTLPTLISVHPTPLYEMLINTIIILVIIFIEKKLKSDEYSFILFLIMFSGYRFFIEFIRLNETAFLGYTAPQIISIFLFTISMIFLIKRRKHVKAYI